MYNSPTPADILNCLASDASAYENAKDFEEWASEYGYDTDSRKPKKIYKVVKTAGRAIETYHWRYSLRRIIVQRGEAMTFPLRPSKLEVTRTPDNRIHIAWGLGPKQETNAVQVKPTTAKAQ